jgi:hypothetical protein
VGFVQVVALDLDGTLTKDGELSSHVLATASTVEEFATRIRHAKRGRKSRELRALGPADRFRNRLESVLPETSAQKSVDASFEVSHGGTHAPREW